MRTKTETLASALDILSNEIQSQDATIKEAANRLRELEIANRRYETVRTLKPRDFAKIYERNLAGEKFDEIIDKLS